MNTVKNPIMNTVMSAANANILRRYSGYDMEPASLLGRYLLARIEYMQAVRCSDTDIIHHCQWTIGTLLDSVCHASSICALLEKLGVIRGHDYFTITNAASDEQYQVLSSQLSMLALCEAGLGELIDSSAQDSQDSQD